MASLTLGPPTVESPGLLMAGEEFPGALYQSRTLHTAQGALGGL